ncbi:MAG: DeoR/GlpR transcriptional regulator [Clostridia bacterium]|nr:DeoR/GlpR transcriptional regulator [Clostridia bacterium]
MLATERETAILKLISENGSVTTAYLMELFDVSVETIRRDLISMEQKGVLSRVHGGAVSTDMHKYSSFPDKTDEHQRLREAELSRSAATFVKNGDIIAVDAGSCAKAFADVLRTTFSRLTVITHSLDVFEALREKDGFNVILCGGQYFKRRNALFGSASIDFLDGFHVSKSFIFPYAVSLDYGISDTDDELCMIQKKLTEISDKVFILADSPRFETKSFVKLCSVRPDFIYITDSDIPESVLKLYAKRGIPFVK